MDKPNRKRRRRSSPVKEKNLVRDESFKIFPEKDSIVTFTAQQVEVMLSMMKRVIMEGKEPKTKENNEFKDYPSYIS